MTTAVGYARVSTKLQEEEGHSLDTQAAKFRAYCEQHGLELGEVYVDVERGRRDDRPEYQQIVAAARAGKIKHIVTQFLDRFGRNTKEILRRYWELEDLGVVVHTTDEDVRNRLLLLIKAWNAEEESKRIGERTNSTVTRLHGMGRWVTMYPLGYTMGTRIDDGKTVPTGKLTVIPSEAQIVRRLYDLALKGATLNELAVTARREGLRGKRGAVLQIPTILYILRNPVYVGHSERRGVWVRDTHEAIIAEDDWHRVQELIARRKRGRTPRDPRTPFPLAGLLRCVHCLERGIERRLYGTVQRFPKDRAPLRVYRCSGVKTGECHLPTIHANIVEGWLVDQLANYRFSEEREHRVPDYQVQIAALKRELERIQGREARAYSEYIDGVVSQPLYRQKAKELERERERVQQELHTAERAAQASARTEEVKAKIEHFAEWWCDAETTDRERRILLGDFLEAIDVRSRRDFTLVWRPWLRGG